MSGRDPVEQRPGAAPSTRTMQFGVAAAGAIALAGIAAFYFAIGHSRRGGGDDQIQVAITAKACEPNGLTVPAGKRSFSIVNHSDRTVEWEILDGVMVVAERENIAPGLKQTLTVDLLPGQYAITCGLLSNPRGTLQVVATAESEAKASKTSSRDFLGPLSEYKFYLGRQASGALRAAGELAEAIKAGNLDTARGLYVSARQPFERIAPVVYRFSDMEKTIDPVATYLEGREADAAFSGYHRIEYGLFSQKSLDGLGPVADRLISDLQSLDSRLREVGMTPDLLMSSASGFAGALSQDRLMTSRNQYAQSDLSDLEANIQGLSKLIGLLTPIVKRVDPALETQINSSLKDVETEFAKLRTGEVLPSYETITKEQRESLARTFAQLAGALNQLPQRIGSNADGS